MNKPKLPPTITINTNQGFAEVLAKPKFDLVHSADPILHQIAPTWDFANPQMDPILLCNGMIDALKRYNGYGLSACQVGHLYRMFVMGMEDEVVAFFNPVIVEKSTETNFQKEGCLSIPGFVVGINRSDWVDVEYQSYTGEQKNAYFTGLTARIFQHEYDHMDGKLVSDVAGPLAFKMAMKKIQKQQRKHARGV